MEKLILAELRSQLLSIWMLLTGALLLGYFTFSFLLLLAPAGLTLYAHFKARRSHWYLQLPWSRKQIASLVGIQIVFLFSVLSMVFISAYFLIRLARNDHSDLAADFLIFALYSPFILIAALNPLTGVPVVVRSVRSKFDFAFVKNLATVAICAISTVLVMQVSETLFYVSLALFAPFLVALVFGNKIVLAPNTFRQLARVSRVAAPVVVLVPFSLSIYFLHFAPATSARTSFAVAYLENIPVPISEKRALELFSVTEIGKHAFLEKHLPALRSNVSFDAWKSRTDKCRYSECWELSVAASTIDRTPASEVVPRFKSLTKTCFDKKRFKLASVCINSMNQQPWFKTWSNALAQDGTLEVWKKTGDAEEQTLARTLLGES